MALCAEWCLLTAWWLMFNEIKISGIHRIRTENTLNNLNTKQKNQIEQKHCHKWNTESNRSAEKSQTKNWQWTIQALIKRLSFKRSWIVTVQHLQGLNIFVITELTIATLFAWMLNVWNQTYWRGFVCRFSLTFNMSLQYQSRSVIAMIVSRE